MAKITAYKCDVCKRISEQPLPFKLPDGWNADTFSVEPAKDYLYEYQPSACSADCIKAALNCWLDNQREQASEDTETRDIVFAGVKPS